MQYHLINELGMLLIKLWAEQVVCISGRVPESAIPLHRFVPPSEAYGPAKSTLKGTLQ